MKQSLCRAIRGRRLLRLNYHWGYRTVEPHAYGLNDNGHELLLVYQVAGASRSGKPQGWKHLRLDEIRELTVLDDTFPGPRPGYRHDDKALDRRIYCQL